MNSLEVDNNVLQTLSSLAKVKPVCIIVKIEFHDDVNLESGKIVYSKGSTLIFTLDTGERFGIAISDSDEAFRQYHYISYLLEQSGGKMKLQP